MKRVFPIMRTIVIAMLACALGGCLVSCSPKTSKNSGQSATKLAVSDKSDQNPYSFTLGFVGDICLADNYIPMQYLASKNSTDITDGIDAQYVKKMNEMDLMWANNEFVFSTSETPLAGKAYTFCAKPSNVSYLHDLGVDIVGLANNHTYDYGQSSFLDTLDTLGAANIVYVGAGRDDTRAYAPVYLDASGIRIAYVAASCAEYTVYTPEATESEPGIAWCYDNSRFLESVREAAAHADFVVVLPHWGVEHSTVLTDEQTEFAHQYIDAGADIVIGTHPHILQGIEYYNGKPILYSLGNFWFDDYDIDTVLAEVQVSGTLGVDGKISSESEVKVTLYPGLQSGVYTAWEEGTKEGSRILSELESICVNVTIGTDGVVHKAS